MEHYLIGKAIIRGQIRVKTGMRIGGASSGLKIGGLDLNVITDPEGKPYIPGSSLKGKLRSLIEKKEAANNPNFWNRDKDNNFTGQHKCESDDAYKKCPVCKIWGIAVSNKITVPTPTRLIVCDAYLDEESIKPLRDNLELDYTEVKFETAINRLTGTALHGSLRQVERVPAGARFKDVELIFSVYENEDKELLKHVFVALELLEHDYLGGMGSRGYGRVAFEDIKVFWNRREDYENGQVELTPERIINKEIGSTAAELVKNFDRLKEKLA
ncbi:MAG: type III-A CRISPR-associated RAMP protein Csm3 [Candidatus Saccharicenans sp.]